MLENIGSSLVLDFTYLANSSFVSSNLILVFILILRAFALTLLTHGYCFAFVFLPRWKTGFILSVIIVSAGKNEYHISLGEYKNGVRIRKGAYISQAVSDFSHR